MTLGHIGQIFDIEVWAYDHRVNANPTHNQFDGTLDDVNIMVLLSLDDNVIATLNGTTQNGNWQGSHYMIENISTPGEYAVDVTASHLGKSVSETSPMFVIGAVPDTGSDKP